MAIFKTPEGLFESSVILEGSKTRTLSAPACSRFESSVILEGSKTLREACRPMS